MGDRLGIAKTASLLLATLAAYGVSAERLGDFDGDGREDVLLRYADGNWRYHGSPQSDTPGAPVRMTRKPEWYWAATGDFDGDGRDDVLLRRADGPWVYYPMDGSHVIADGRGWANLTRNLDWRVVGVADFNDDGRDDVLMRRTDGAWVYYPMNGRRVVAAERGWANLPRDVDWRIAGTGDFDGDGRPDVLLRHVEGEWRYYAMHGRRVVAGQSRTTRLPHDLRWQFASTGDFDGDGRDEVLLRHVDGRWRYGAIDGEATRAASLRRDWVWRLVGVGDSDGDGRDDVLLRHAGGSWLWDDVLETAPADAVRGLPGDTAWAVPARPVHFPDPALRRAVEDALRKASGEFVRPRELAGLRALEADFAGIADLTGIGLAVELSRLNIEFNRIRSIVPLAGLVGLRSLYLRSNRVDDIATLAHLPSLTILDLGDNRIVDVSPLSGLVGLRHLQLDLNHGQHSGHAGVGIEDVGPLAGLTELRHLDLSFNRVRDVSPLAGLGALRRLFLFENRISDITPLGGLTALTSLSLARNEIEDVATLSRFTGLEYLAVGDNNVADWSPLAELTQLTSLGLWRGGVEDLSMLSGMTQLERLDLYDNNIEDISVLARMPALERLDLAGNRIADISPLAGLTSLTRLSLRNNRIEDISWLAGLRALEILDLARNAIVDIAAVSGLTALKELDLSYNRIADLAPLADNGGLDAGDRIDVRGNPLNAGSLETVVPALLARGVLVEASAPPRLASVHDDSVVVLRVEEDIASLDLFSGLPLDAYARTLFSHYEDAFDFVMFFSNLDARRDHDDSHYVGVYSSVRNDTAGIGLLTFYDNRYGSAERLKGVIHFPYNRALLHGRCAARDFARVGELFDPVGRGWPLGLQQCRRPTGRVRHRRLG